MHAGWQDQFRALRVHAWQEVRRGWLLTSNYRESATIQDSASLMSVASYALPSS